MMRRKPVRFRPIADVGIVAALRPSRTYARAAITPKVAVRSDAACPARQLEGPILFINEHEEIDNAQALLLTNIWNFRRLLRTSCFL